MKKIIIENCIPFFPIARCNDVINFVFVGYKLNPLVEAKKERKVAH